MKSESNRPPEAVNTVDLIALAMCLIMLAVYAVGAARSNQLLIWTGIAIGLPGVVMKVRSSRAKSRWWYEHGKAWREQHPDESPQN